MSVLIITLGLLFAAGLITNIMTENWTALLWELSCMVWAYNALSH